MEEVFKTTSIEERNTLIEKLYNSNIKYKYWDKNKEGEYIVKYESLTK